MKDINKCKLGKNIKIQRLIKDITQEYFAELVDISLSHAAKIEQGLTSPSSFVLYKMSKVLDTPMEEFFKGINL